MADPFQQPDILGERPSYDDLVARVEALEHGRKIDLNDIPMADLGRALDVQLGQGSAQELFIKGVTIQVPINGQMVGPLNPLAGTGTAAGTKNVTTRGGTVYVLFGGSGFLLVAGAQMGLDFYVDGVLTVTHNVGQNPATTHRTWPPYFGAIPTLSKPGAHTIELRNGAPGGTQSQSDSTDRFICVLFEVV